MIDWLLKYWLEVLFGLALSGLGLLGKVIHARLKQREAEDVAIKNGLLAVLHDRLYIECGKCIEQEYITLDEMENIKHLYGAYTALGGNGTGTALYNRAMALELKT